MPETQHRYFQFSRRERRGIYVLLFCTAIVFSAPAFLRYLVPDKRKNPNSIPFSQLPLAVVEDTFAGRPYSKTRTFREYRNFNDDDPFAAEPQTGTTFFFDPNTISAAEWEKLGVRPKTVQTILNYRAKGGTFKTPEDLDKIFGLSDKDVQRLMPFVQIAQQNLPASNGSGHTTYLHNNNFSEKYPAKNNNIMLNINTADTLNWKLLPGIGPGYARRIVNYRQKLGGFNSVEQVAETYGLPDSVFQKIKDRLQFTETKVQKININTATAEMLFAHPYISKNLANNIVQYRNQHGLYKSAEDLKRLALMNNDNYLKISQYLTTE